MSAKADIITLNGESYDVAEMTDQQREVLRHVRDLEKRLAQAEFNMTQLRVGREAFLATLAELLQQSEDEDKA